MIIDCHVHVKGGDVYRREFSPETILKTMDEAGIEKSVIFSMCLPSRESNELTLRCYRACPDRFIPFAHVMPTEGKLALLELDRAINDCGCRGLKLHLGELPEVNMPQIKAVCERGVELDIPVLIDFANNFEAAADLAGSLPELKLIVAHLGSPQNEVTVDKFIALALDLGNIYLDSSYSFVPWKIPDAIGLLGADRVIFGSDGPLIHPSIELAKIGVCNLSEEDFGKVTRGNIEKLLP